MGKKILMVEDNIDFRKIVRSYLENQGMDLQIFEATTGEAGMEEALLIEPDIVLMDIRLPHMDGIHAAEHIKRDNPNCCVIALTMFDDAEYRTACGDGKIDAFIGKSDLYERLVPMIKKCLAKKGKDNGNSKEKRSLS